MRKPKILIVDDRRENLVALRRLLAKVEAEVVEAEEATEAPAEDEEAGAAE